MNLREQIQNHPFVIVAAAFAAGASMAWVVANEVLVKPRDYDIQRQKGIIAELTSAARSSSILPSAENSLTRSGTHATQRDSLVSLAPTTLEIASHLSPANFETAIKSLRKSKNLREITALESGNPISQMPFGTYFFVQAHSFDIKAGDLSDFWNRGKVERFGKYRGLFFEVLYLAERKALVIGFVSDDALANISKLDGLSRKRLSLSPLPWGQMTNLVLVPVERMIDAKNRPVSIGESNTVYVVDMLIR